MSNETRQPAGVPVGGQFATTIRGELDPGLAASTPATALDDELADLTDDAQAEYEQAFEYAQDCKEDADQASVIGSRQEKAVTLAMEAAATTALDVAERRRTALALATNPAAGRPDYADYANPRTIAEIRKAVKDAKAGKVHGLSLI